MQIVVSAQGTDTNSLVDTRFGRAKHLLLVDTEAETAEELAGASGAGAAQGAGVQAASAIAATPAAALISGNVGPRAFTVLERAGIACYLATEVTVAEAVAALERGELPQQNAANVQEHW